MNRMLLRKQVLERDGNICQTCFKEFDMSKLQVHHIIPVRKHGLDSMNNLITQCRECHKQIELERSKISNGQKYTMIKVSDETHRLLNDLGGRRETFENIIRRLIEFYKKGMKR